MFDESKLGLPSQVEETGKSSNSGSDDLDVSSATPPSDRVVTALRLQADSVNLPGLITHQ